MVVVFLINKTKGRGGLWGDCGALQSVSEGARDPTTASRRERTETQLQLSPEKDLKHTQSQKADTRQRPCAPENWNKPRVILLTLADFSDKTMKTSEL